jgi:amino acid adenylation domain-containing protein
LSEALRAFSRQENVTLFMTLLAAFKTLLYCYSGQTDILVGFPISNRNQVETEGLIGLFLNTLVLRTTLSGDLNFREILARVREVTIGAYAHQDLPLEKLVDDIQLERNLRHNPLFQVMFVLANVPREVTQLAGLTARALEVERDSALLELTLAIEDHEQGLMAMLEYNADLFEASTIGRLLGHLETLLGGVVAEPHQRVSDLPLLSPLERRQVLETWNATQAPYPDALSIHHLVEAQASRTPEAVAVISGRDQLSYGALNARANQLAHALRQRGVGGEDRVGVCLDRTVSLVVGVVGILKSGGAYVPLDPSYPESRLSFMVEDAGVSLVVSEQSLVSRLPALEVPVLCLDAEAQGLSTYPVSNPSRVTSPHQLAYVIYTSGSTGTPKGVAIAHRSAVALLSWARTVFPPEVRAGVLAATSVCFDLSVFELFLPLSWGGTAIIADHALHLPTLAAAQAVTLLNTVPSAMAELLRVGGLPASVRTVNLAGEPLRSSLVQALYAYETIERVFDLYGPSEDTTYSTYALRRVEGPETIGRPVANTQVYLLDSGLQPVPVGVSGEVYIGGLGLSRCYLNRPGLTAEKFIPHPFSTVPGERLYHTGDLARYLPNGQIEFLGRVDHQVKIRGYRIELGEIEAVLEAHPTVRETVVIVNEDISGDKRLVAYVVLQADRPQTIDELRAFLQARLPAYSVPATLVRLDALPLTPNGKVDRRALPAPSMVRPELHEAYEKPRTSVEDVLAGIWTAVLGIDQVGIHDDFFDLGGHSLLATQVVSRLRDTFKVEFPLRGMFETPTVASLAQRIEVARRDTQGFQEPSILSACRDAELPLSIAQQHLLRLNQLMPQMAFFNMPIAFRLQGQLNVTALEQTFYEIVRRHEILRTIYIRQCTTALWK